MDYTLHIKTKYKHPEPTAYRRELAADMRARVLRFINRLSEGAMAQTPEGCAVIRIDSAADYLPRLQRIAANLTSAWGKDAAAEVVAEPRPAHSIDVQARRWFDKTYGNTYFAARISVDGEPVHLITFDYGYDDHYITEAAHWLEDNGYMPNREHHGNGSAEPLWSYCRARGIELTYSAEDVNRKRELVPSYWNN